MWSLNAVGGGSWEDASWAALHSERRQERAVLMEVSTPSSPITTTIHMPRPNLFCSHTAIRRKNNVGKTTFLKLFRDKKYVF